MKKDGREAILSALEYRLLLVLLNNPESIIGESDEGELSILQVKSKNDTAHLGAQ